MKSKYLSTLMIAVLTTFSVSTFTSCKDYTDDINNLQAQIDKASLATDVQTLKAQVEAAIASSTATADKAKQDIDANAANISNLDNALKTLEGTISTSSKATTKRIDSLANAGTVTDTEILNLQKANKAAADSAASALAKNKELSDELTKTIKQWTDAKADYYTAEEIDNILYIISAYFEDIDARLNEAGMSIGDLKKEIDNYKIVVNALYTAVTEVSIVTGNGTKFASDLKFDYGKVAEDLTFGKEEKDDAATPNTYSAKTTKTYQKDAQLIFPTEILVKVNPVNANITPSMIKLVNSKGETLDSLLEITKVEKYDEQLTKVANTNSEETKSRASIGSGLWKVTLQPKANLDVENKIAQTTKVGNEDKSILFAVAINNTASQAESAKDAADRYVVSDYELTVGKGGQFEEATYSASSKENTGITVKGNDLRDCKEYTATGASTDFISSNNGEDIEISFAGDAVKDKIDCFYIVGDKKLGSNVEWSAYPIEGLNQIVAVSNGAGKAHIKVTIKDDASMKDLSIPFRIFAVNHNGKYYNQAGNCFTLYVTKETKQASVTADMNCTGYEKMESSWTKITADLLDADDQQTPSIINQKTVVVTDTANHQVTLNVEYAQDAEGKTTATKDSEIKYVKFSLSGSNISNWTNESNAKGTITNNKNTLQVSLTKKMPTKENAATLINKSYTWKENRLVNGIYTAYMYPAFAGTYAWGSSDPNACWNKDASLAFINMNGKGPLNNFPYGDKGYTINLGEKISYYGTSTVYCVPKFVDNKTQYDSKISYNFGNISSDKEKDGYSEGNNYVVILESFKTILANPLDENVQTYTWEKLKTSASTYEDVNYLTYGDETQHVTSDVSKPGAGETWSVLNYIKGSNKYDDNEFGKTMNVLMYGNNAKYTLYWLNVKLISQATGKEDYFRTSISYGTSEKTTNISFTPINTDEANNPAQDVPSFLVFTLYDAFGQTHTIQMPFTVKRRK